MTSERAAAGGRETPEPRRPKEVSVHARACLEALAASGLGRALSLGGYFGLAHYLEYRATHDADAWWVEPVSAGERRAVVATIERALAPFGAVRTRSWGDVVSVELGEGGKAAFSFQIARRSASLEEPRPSSWAGVRVDTLADLVAAKMAALVERGAPRDLRDIYMVCERGLVTVDRCWDLWRARQNAAGEEGDLRRAALAVRSHLARLERARPLEGIADAGARAAAERVRDWFVKEFLSALPD